MTSSHSPTMLKIFKLFPILTSTRKQSQSTNSKIGVFLYPKYDPSLQNVTRKMFLLTKTKRPKKVHCNKIYSRKRFLKIKTSSAERRSES